MRTPRHARWPTLLLSLLQIGCVAGACCGGGRWHVPPATVAPAQLPKLTHPIRVDGDLSEWSSAASVPVRHASDICFHVHAYQWPGPAGVSMEGHFGWRPEGLCLAARVVDDRVVNPRTDGQIWLEDGVELYLDGRPAGKQATSPYTPGAYQVLITPPLPDRPAHATVNDRDGEIEGLQVAGRSTPTGYIIEALVPWSAFPELTPEPGARVSLNLAVNDYDGDDPDTERPVQLNSGGAKLMWEHPEGCIRWELVDSPRTGEEVPLAPLAVLDLPSVSGDGSPLRLSADIGSMLSGDVASARFRLVDADGDTMLDRTVQVSPLPAPWADSVHAELEWRPDPAPADGLAVVTAILYDSAARPLGFVNGYIPFVRRAQLDALARLEAADLPKLSQTDPFRAAAYLGVGSCYERLKRAVEIQGRPAAVQAASELTARLDVLEGREAAPEGNRLLDLLDLAAEPEAQVVIEYPGFSNSADGPDVAYVTFYWGAVPLIGATVLQYPSAEEAAKRLEPSRNWVLADVVERTSLDGLPARLSTWYSRRLFDLNGFSPEDHIALVVKGSDLLRVVSTDLLTRAQVDAVTVLPDCPPSVRDSVTAWAKKTGRPMMDLQHAIDQDKALIAGDVRTVADRLGKQWAFIYALRSEPVDLMVLAADRAIAVSGPSRPICDGVARLILAGRTVSASQVDALRLDIVRQLAPQAPAPPTPAGLNLYCGDVHMHSFYSDGTPSPVGLWLQALYNYMDFAVMTDHDTIQGALVAHKLLHEHGFSFPFIVGEEVTADWSHFNAYPLTATISPSLPAHDMFKAAHVQGAVIQWNHPGAPMSDWAAVHLAHGLGDTSLDAWEHLPDAYREWKQAGTLPVIVGATDTHDGTFGSYLERTIILAPTPQGDDLAEAIRSGRVVAVIQNTDLLYGSDRMISLAWEALAEGTALKAGTAERLKTALSNADLVGLLRASPPRPIPLGELTAR